MTANAEHDADRRFADLHLVGGRPCLDFTNTVSGRRAGERRDRLTSYEALARWSRHAGLIDQATLRRLLAAQQERPDDAARVLERAVALRESLYRMLRAAGDGRRPRAADITVLNREWCEALKHLQLTTGEPCCTVECRGAGDALDRMLWTIAQSATELLTSGDVQRVKACDDQECAWLFVDESRNRSRRWCDMRDCGNRAKARRFYARRSGGGPRGRS